MAAGDITNTKVAGPTVVGHRKRSVVRSSALDYATGGLSIPASAFGLSVIDEAQSKVAVSGTGSVTAADYDNTNQKVLLYTATAQVANDTDLTNVVVETTAFGW